jgi:xeroderma pigmentosum group C-complementing protein
MLPEGAAHIPRRGTVKICKRLGIDYAEAVTGFEFGHRMAVPIINGVVIAEEHCDAVMEEWEKEEIERVRKEDEKRTKTALTTWKKFLMGMRIIERVREEYGDELDNNPDVLNPYISKKAQNTDRQLEVQARIMAKRDEEMAGGFLPAGHEYGEPYEHHGPSFFPIINEDEDDQGGGFVVEEHDEPTKPSITQAYATTQALESSRTKKTSNADEDIEMEKAELAEVVPQAKKRGRPPGPPKKAIQQTAKSVKGKMPAKRALPQKTPQLKVNGKSKHKAEVKDSEEEDEGQDSSSVLSDFESSSELGIESEPESEPEAIPQKTARKAPRRRATLPTQPKKTPRRTATKNQGLRSRYFDHDDLDDDDG